MVGMQGLGNTHTTFREEPSMTSLQQETQRPLEEVFNDIVEEYSTFAYNVAYRMLRKVEDAEDAVQEAFVSAYRAYPRFKGQSKVSTWLYRIVVNTCLMKIRKEKRHDKYLADTGYDDAVAVDWTGDPQASAINVELREALETGLGQLPLGLRTAVTLRDVQGFSNAEAAEILDTTVSTFKSRLHRGRVLLRKHLEGYLATRS